MEIDVAMENDVTGQIGICPVCDGSKRRPVPDDMRKYVPNLYKYDPDTDTLPCRNCGGQTMSGNGVGTVPLRADGTPCTHEYDARNSGRCLTTYTCKHCISRYVIDSGD